MTYCVAWKYNNNIYMVGDSATTRSGDPLTGTTSIGQLQKNDQNMTVEESALKIVPVSPHCVIAMAGDVRSCIKMATFIRDNYQQELPLNSLLKMAITSIGPLTGECHLLIGQHLNGVAELHEWRSNDYEKLIDIIEFSDIGSADYYTKTFTKDIITKYICPIQQPLFMLPFATGLLMSHSAHANLIKSGVGGCVFGIELSSKGYQWQPDTTYLFYRKDLTISDAVVTAVRNDSAVVLCKVYQANLNQEMIKKMFNGNIPADLFDKPAMMHKIFSVFDDTSTPELLDDLSDNMKRLKTKIFTMISLFNRNIVVIWATGETPTGKYFSIDLEKSRIEFQPELIQKMTLMFENPSPPPAIDLFLSHLID